MELKVCYTRTSVDGAGKKFFLSFIELDSPGIV